MSKRSAKRILIIEDEPHISRLVKFILEKEGYSIIQAFVGREGIELAKAQKPDLIVLDVMMPNMDGFEVASTLSADRVTKDIPIIMLSSAAQFKDKIKGLESGALHYLTKPFEHKELIDKVKECLG